jgi:drug/metabolite transporter (DMT)-like permease
MNVTIPLVLFSVFLNTVAQLMLKQTMNHIGAFTFTLTNLFPIGMRIAFSPYFIAGMLCYVGSVLVWLCVLSRLEVSVAYPMASLGYISTAIAAYWLLGEDLSFSRIIGIFVIIAGVYLVSRS